VTPAVAIEATTTAHYPGLHEGLNHPSVAQEFRWRGEHLAAESFERTLHDRATRSWTIVDGEGAVVGLVQLLGVNATDRFGELVLATFPHAPPSAAGQALLLALRESFRRHDLRKVYFHLSPGAARRFGASLEAIGRREGVLRDHLWVDGGYRDVVVASVYREDLDRHLHTTQDGRIVLADGTTDPGAAGGRGPGGPLERVLDVFGVDPADAERPLDQVLADSLVVAEVLGALEEVAGRELDVEAVLVLETVGDLVALRDAVAEETA
jgi:acyl carrier protein/RimJ/RimL family protein N-acetyltransferase